MSRCQVRSPMALFWGPGCRDHGINCLAQRPRGVTANGPDATTPPSYLSKLGGGVQPGVGGGGSWLKGISMPTRYWSTTEWTPTTDATKMVTCFGCKTV